MEHHIVDLKHFIHYIIYALVIIKLYLIARKIDLLEKTIVYK